ncbi:MAG: diguanylate cyclase [Desulfobacterales bacterium]
MMMSNSRADPIRQYLDDQAPIIFLVLDDGGTILRMNRFAEKILGADPVGSTFKNLIGDFHSDFDLDAAIKRPGQPHILSIQMPAGMAQSYYFCFFSGESEILAFGHLDVEELEQLSNELVAANQELNNLMRELNAKNRALRQANERIVELTRADALTGLANRRYFDERIEEMVSLANRKSQPLSLVMTDIDKFKRVNDEFGHDAGDRVLKGYADLMRTSTRREELVVRFGGEEFIILMPLTNMDQAYLVAERIRKALPGLNLLENDWIITASFGVSELQHSENIDNFVKRADMALYRAKASGRNQTMCAD